MPKLWKLLLWIVLGLPALGFYLGSSTPQPQGGILIHGKKGESVLLSGERAIKAKPLWN